VTASRAGSRSVIAIVALLMSVVVLVLMAAVPVAVAAGAHYASDTIGRVLLGCAVVAAWTWWRSGSAQLGQQGGAE
jgi:membrane-associated phospholipid phosphatase